MLCFDNIKHSVSNDFRNVLHMIEQRNVRGRLTQANFEQALSTYQNIIRRSNTKLVI